VAASPHPKENNGIKMGRREAFPPSGESGINDIRDMIAAGQLPPAAARPGTLTQANVADDYTKHVQALVDLSTIKRGRSFGDLAGIKPLNGVLGAGSGIARRVAPLLFAHIPTKKLTTLCFE